MAKATIARIEGDDYQAKLFWLMACRLFMPYTKVGRVSYEHGDIKSFDDIVVDYVEPVPDGLGGLVKRDYFQVKFHVAQDSSMTARSLIDPSFIGASSVSLLERVRDAVHKADSEYMRLCFVTTSSIDQNDALGGLVSNNLGEIRLDRLQQGGPNSQRFGSTRVEWAEHLGVSEDELMRILKPLRIAPSEASLDALNSRLNEQLVQAGMKPIDATSSVSPYDDLIRKLVRSGQTSFSADDIKEICTREGLWVGTPFTKRDEFDIGIRSFARWTEYLEDLTIDLLDLVPHFDGRDLLPGKRWGDVANSVSHFLSANVRSGSAYRIYLDAHSSIAFTAGYVLDPKSGAQMTVMQKVVGAGHQPWDGETAENGTDQAGWTVETETVDPSESGIALAISVSRDVRDDVQEFVRIANLKVGSIAFYDVVPAPGQRAISDGAQCFRLAEELVNEIRDLRKAAPGTKHLFIAAPNAFTFTLGQISRVLGQCVLYEYGFESGRRGAYSKSIELPGMLETGG